jgi:hypothetical protein
MTDETKIAAADRLAAQIGYSATSRAITTAVVKAVIREVEKMTAGLDPARLRQQRATILARAQEVHRAALEALVANADSSEQVRQVARGVLAADTERRRLGQIVARYVGQHLDTLIDPSEREG